MSKIPKYWYEQLFNGSSEAIQKQEIKKIITRLMSEDEEAVEDITSLDPEGNVYIVDKVLDILGWDVLSGTQDKHELFRICLQEMLKEIPQLKNIPTEGEEQHIIYFLLDEDITLHTRWSHYDENVDVLGEE